MATRLLAAAHPLSSLLSVIPDPRCRRAPIRVVPRCRLCHRAYDLGDLDLLPHLEPRWRPELAHALLHLGLLRLLRRLSGACAGCRWIRTWSDERPKCIHARARV